VPAVTVAAAGVVTVIVPAASEVASSVVAAAGDNAHGPDAATRLCRSCSDWSLSTASSAFWSRVRFRCAVRTAATADDVAELVLVLVPVPVPDPARADGVDVGVAVNGVALAESADAADPFDGADEPDDAAELDVVETWLV
jgi:hypothetical protein